jgi:HK97 family phage major capsid protein
MSNKLLQLKRVRVKQIEDELKGIKTLLDISPPEQAAEHYERAESLLKDLEEINRDIKLLEEENRNASDPDGRTAAVTGQIPGIITSNARSQQKELPDKQEQEYRTAFFNYLRGKETAEERALVTVSSGAAAIPTTTWQEIISNIQKQQGLIGRVRILEIPGKVSIPVGDIQTPATWHEEGAEIQDSNAPPNAVNLTGYELAKLFSLSAASQEMTISAFEGYLVAELTRCTRDALNAAIFDGTGNGQPSGINSIIWDETNSKTVSGWEEVAAAMGLLPSNFRQNAVFVMNSSTFYGTVATFATSEGFPVLASNVADGMPLRLLGKEIVIDDFCPDNTIYFCDPMYYFINFSRPIFVERSIEAGFTKGSILYRSLAVVDGKPATPLAFVKLTVATSP